jgi:hypothetical protein
MIEQNMQSWQPLPEDRDATPEETAAATRHVRETLVRFIASPKDRYDLEEVAELLYENPSRVAEEARRFGGALPPYSAETVFAVARTLGSWGEADMFAAMEAVKRSNVDASRESGR